MKYYYRPITILLYLLLCNIFPACAQKDVADSSLYYNQVKTYINPVLPGDHPDPTLLKVGNDFYYCGSSFHFTPYLPIYHSKDLIHWQIVSRVVAPSSSVGWVTDRPSAGIWQGALTYFYGSYWIYFSANGQWFSKASSPKGPWSTPVRVKTNSKTGPLGYDNSIFVDDDGKPYMLIKNGQRINRIQAIGRNGQLTDTVINLDWVNTGLQYNWAEGPVMCKRNGFYYYFVAGSVAGGEYVLRTRKLTGDSTQWQRLGNFFKLITDSNAGFKGPNHIAAPVRLADGSWWTIAQSYERYKGNDWSGMGRQTSLYRVTWKKNRPWGMAPVSTPIVKPDLPQSGILWRSVHSDYFNHDSLNVCWHFLNRKAARSYSLSARKGWIRLIPDGERTHLLQKETDHYYTAVTKVDLDADNPADKAGLYLTNGNQSVTFQLCSTYDKGKKIIFKLDTAIREVPNKMGDVVWLKIERKEHQLTGYYSSDGNDWKVVGAPISAVILDKEQPNFNSWVGTSVGLFAQGKPADFDFFICKDGLSPLPAVGYRNYFGIEKVQVASKKVVTNTSDYGGWFVISGVDLGKNERLAGQVEVLASSPRGGKLEIWLDGLVNGKRIATITIKPTGGQGNFKDFIEKIKPVSGHHDVFVKFSQGTPGEIYIQNIKFLRAKGV